MAVVMWLEGERADLVRKWMWGLIGVFRVSLILDDFQALHLGSLGR